MQSCYLSSFNYGTLAPPSSRPPPTLIAENSFSSRIPFPHGNLPALRLLSPKKLKTEGKTEGKV